MYIWYLYLICLSRGAEFRTCFQQIGGLRALTDAPLIAVTATAPKAIQSKICDSLGLKEPAVISQTLDRPNIYFSCSKSKGLNVSDYILIRCPIIHIDCAFTLSYPERYEWSDCLSKNWEA